ncbi:MAG: MFS transporter [Acidobacteria bacterium]|nr:MFS transporter [Acidobacteriota bacterium]MBV9622798.1 MFS transporter [Acidobacteriota bacterium]
MVSAPKPAIHNVSRLRWWVGALLFASTVINYVDRQTLSLLAPYLKVQYHWTNTDYANIVIAFRVAYSIGQAVFGRGMDRMGTRLGLTLAVVFYSIVSILTSFARGLHSFFLARFLLGAGESANWPAATKAVSEWFPKHERALATALFDSGSSVGGAIAPFLVLPIYFRWGWRAAFVVPGILGLFWLIIWRLVYYPPQNHPWISLEERRIICENREEVSTPDRKMRAGWSDLLKYPQTWGTIIAKSFTDPVWFFVTDWFPIFLVAKGFEVRSGIIAVWIPFIAADAGNFFSGGISGYLIKRGWTVGAARKALVVAGGLGVMLLIPTVLTSNLYLITVLFALAAFAYSCFSTMANVLPADLYYDDAVASVSGLSGCGAGIGTVVAFELIGHLSDARRAAATHAFDPIIVTAGLVPFVGMLLVLLLVRNTRATAEGRLRRI